MDRLSRLILVRHGETAGQAALSHGLAGLDEAASEREAVVVRRVIVTVGVERASRAATPSGAPAEVASDR